jgi:hypothetical protein
VVDLLIVEGGLFQGKESKGVCKLENLTKFGRRRLKTKMIDLLACLGMRLSELVPARPRHSTA